MKSSFRFSVTKRHGTNLITSKPLKIQDTEVADDPDHKAEEPRFVSFDASVAAKAGHGLEKSNQMQAHSMVQKVMECDLPDSPEAPSICFILTIEICFCSSSTSMRERLRRSSVSRLSTLHSKPSCLFQAQMAKQASARRAEDRYRNY